MNFIVIVNEQPVYDPIYGVEQRVHLTKRTMAGIEVDIEEN